MDYYGKDVKNNSQSQHLNESNQICDNSYTKYDFYKSLKMKHPDVSSQSLNYPVEMNRLSSDPSTSSFYNSGNTHSMPNISSDNVCQPTQNIFLADFQRPPPTNNPSISQYSLFPPPMPSLYPSYLQSPNIQSLPPPMLSMPSALSSLPFNIASNSPLINAIDTSHPPPNMFLKDCDKNFDKWLDDWLASRNLSSKKIHSVKHTASINEYRNKVINLSKQIKILEKMHTCLQVMCKSLDEDEWLIRKKEIEKQKVLVQSAVDDLKRIPFQDIILMMKKRKSKRDRLKRKNQEYKQMRNENKALRQLEHSRIDMWLEKMKEHVERARREEDIKNQADYVLSEVFHKKAEAKRMLSLLTTLGKLRNARIRDRESKGEFVSKEAANAFNTIIENLKKRWMNQINGYNLEEQGLRVMLNDNEIERSNVEKTLSKQILQHWLNIIFGNDRKSNSFQATSINKLISVRKSWDRYIIEDSSVLGSSIPNGWILPAPPSNDVWSKFIRNS